MEKLSKTSDIEFPTPIISKFNETDFPSPIISNLIDGNDALTFCLSNTDVCFANAIRRTILSDIDVCCILSENHDTNQVHIDINTSRLHNEILKHRLSCIPVHVDKNLSSFCDLYSLEIDCHNDTDSILFVTSQDFHIKNKLTGDFLTDSESKKIFPPNSISNDFIDFARLRPKITESIPGEKLKLQASFSIQNSGFNAMYNVVSKCSYSNTIDTIEVDNKWKHIEFNLKDKHNIPFHKKNFYLLDAQRTFITNSFDFIIQGIHIFHNINILQIACQNIILKFYNIITHIQHNSLPIYTSESSMNFSFDIILLNEDYTIGKILEFIIYTKFYKLNHTLSFCAFKKFHPHDTNSTIRIAFKQNSQTLHAKHILHTAATIAIQLFSNIYNSL